MDARFEVIPAIDLRGGRVVRLTQGDFERETVFSDDPVAVAREFVAAGARWIHLIDLDGARAGEPVQADAIRALISELGDDIRWQVGGGLRRPEAVSTMLAAGARRVVLGTAALERPAFAAEAIEAHGADRIAAALDVRGGRAIGHGWASGSNAQGVAMEVTLDSLVVAGVTTFVVTAIDRDGLLGGPDLELLRRCAFAVPGRVIASGGIASLADLQAAREAGCAGAVVGRAIYEGRFTLTEALATIAA